MSEGSKRLHVLVFANEKGGTGKSTIACNLAVALALSGRDVVIVDADPQSSAARWSERRASMHPDRAAVHCVQRTGEVFHTAVDLAQRYQEVIIDAGGRDSRELRSSMLAAARVYMPARPSQLDLEAALHVDELVKAASASRADGGPKAFAILTQCPTHHMSTESVGAQEYLSQYTSMQLAVTRIAERKVFRDAMTAGLGVLELDNKTASDEITQFMNEVYAS